MYTVESGQIKFIQSCLPSLDAGEYRITIGQKVVNAGDSIIPQIIKSFVVKGARFSLDPDDVYSVYPASNHQGNFDNSLPHIILSRRTLPWERTMDGSLPQRHPGQAEPQAVEPWMALLLFQEGEIPTVQNLTLDQLNSADQDTITPDIILDPDAGDSASVICSVIDIPLRLFLNIAPQKEELKYLAHVRLLNTDNKETSGSDTGGWFSVIIGSRLPKSGSDGIVNTVHLVSLEGLQNYLPGSGKPSSSKYTKIRLVSLKSWSFTSLKKTNSFKDILSKLSRGKGLNLSMSKEAVTDEEKVVDNAVTMGYAALQHRTRLGEKTYSWYRSPLTPMILQNESSHFYPCADAAVRYDPGTGLFDVSYATAWQLGRLLSLQNQSFAAAVYKWRRESFNKARLHYTRNTLRKNIGETLALDKADGRLTSNKMGIHIAVMEYWRLSIGRKLLAKRGTDYLLSRTADPSGLKHVFDRLPGLISENDMEEILQSGLDPVTAVFRKVFSR